MIGTGNCVGGVIKNSFGEIWIDGMNSYGLMTALLNYRKEMTEECAKVKNRIKLHPGKLIPYLLENCRNTLDASETIASLELTADFPEMYPHYVIADKRGKCVVFENGKVYENTFGVLTNAPSFPEITECLKENSFDKTDFYSSESRFVRVAHLRERVRVGSTSDCFDFLSSVSLPDGADDRLGYRTLLRSVMSADDMTYSYAEGCSGIVKTVSANGIFEIQMG